MSAIQQKAYELAKLEIGVKEVVGSKHNPKIIEYHATTGLAASSDEVPWCSSFVNWCITMANGVGTNSALARSWLAWGQRIEKPVVGDIVVLSRGNSLNQGHVGFLADKVKIYLPYIHVLGGNQSNQVNVSRQMKWNILGYRRAKV